ncbi:polysaccharide deacetylase family protein [Shivajiella indica]|uniref:Polysaccharide deacetylase family protein n=1 Tax=Shivajiella indica TaxID=872115 RepID=A0ABW5B6R4_9BACT
MKKLFIPILCFWALQGYSQTQTFQIKTEILKWPDGKKAAISMTYDDGTLNQFKVALPIMEELGMRGTFYINTGEIPGEKNEAKFIGRSPEIILAETEYFPTSQANIFERAGLIRFLDMPNAVSFHDRSGAAYEQGRKTEAYRILDEGFAQARAMGVNRLTPPKIIDGPMLGWEELRKFAGNGHEFGVHTISHPRLAVLDEENLIYELEKCAEDIERELGKKYLFSAECPFGTENERVMEYALEMFPATRNRMPEPYMEEFNRSSSFDPTKDFGKEYIQWQRGPLSKTSPELMKSWVDDILTRDDTWLVLVFHGIEGIGWEAIPEERIRTYFEYIASKSQDIWVGTFAEVTKYMRQRMASRVDMEVSSESIKVNLTTELDPYWYDQALTLKTYIPFGWEKIFVVQDGQESQLKFQEDTSGKFVQYTYLPNKGPLILKSI